MSDKTRPQTLYFYLKILPARQGGPWRILKQYKGYLHDFMVSTKNHWLAHLRGVNFMVCKLYFNKVVKNYFPSKTHFYA